MTQEKANKILQELREIVIKAVYPNWVDEDKLIVIVCPSCVGEGCVNCDSLAVVDAEKPIYLNEVLIALEDIEYELGPTVNKGEVEFVSYELQETSHAQWNLTKDLDNQEPEVHEGLLKLLKRE